MFRLLIPMGLFCLSACAPVRDGCASLALRDLTVLRGLIAESEATLARGYALRPRGEVILYTDFCPAGDQFGTEDQFCDRLQPTTRMIPVAVDLEQERAKLGTLKRKEQLLAGEVQRDLGRCESANG